MGKLNIKNGTPIGNEHLCRNCLHGQYTTGYRETEVLVVCGNLTPAMVIPFPVRECTDFWDRHRPSWDDMKRFALDLSKVHRKATPGFRQKGFAAGPVVVNDPHENEGEDEDADENADDIAARLLD